MLRRQSARCPVAQLVRPLANELANIGKAPEKRTTTIENGSQGFFARVFTFVFEPRRTEPRSRGSTLFSFIFFTDS